MSHRCNSSMLPCWKLGQFAMPEGYENENENENWLGLVNNCIYYACQTCEICQVLPYSVDFKSPREL